MLPSERIQVKAAAEWGKGVVFLGLYRFHKYRVLTKSHEGAAFLDGKSYVRPCFGGYTFFVNTVYGTSRVRSELSFKRWLLEGHIEWNRWTGYERFSAHLPVSEITQ